MTKYTKISDEEIEVEEIKIKKYSKHGLLENKKRIEKRLANINEKLAVFEK